METAGRPKFLGNPDVPTPCSQTPARPTRPGHTAGRHGSTRIVRRELSTRGNFGAQSHGIGTSCLRFAVRLTPPHARLASGCRPSSTRRDWLPVGFLRKVSVMLLTSLSPFPSFLAQMMSLSFSVAPAFCARYLSSSLRAQMDELENVRFSGEDCSLLQRYPNSLRWADVPAQDKERFKDLRKRLKDLATAAAKQYPGSVAMREDTALYTPNGRSPTWMWCLIYPKNVPNKSFSLQIALIILADRAEFSFCVGAGRDQVKDPTEKAENQSALLTLRKRMQDLSGEAVSQVEGRLGTQWKLRTSWKLPPGDSDFPNLKDWLTNAASADGGGASISQYVTPQQLEDLGPTVLDRLVSVAAIFQPFVEEIYGSPSLSYSPTGSSSGQTEPTISSSLPFNISVAIEDVSRSIAECGYIFEPWQIAAYITALRTKPFVILAGVSGTGKSKLPALVAKATGGESRLISVRPDWTDSSDVLGYLDLQQRFRPGLLLEFARDAESHPDRFYVCIVDEMNLARIEHYFAEVLSRIEDRRPSPNGGFESSALLSQSLPESEKNWATQRLPPNLAIVGTVNMDESAHGFSRKVLDRAFTIELSDVDLSQWETKPSNEPMIQHWNIASWHPRAIQLAGVGPVTEAERKEVDATISSLVEINKILVEAQLQVGYRTRDELTLFLLNAASCKSSFVTNAGESVSPVDVVLQMKILPRIAGGTSGVRRTVLRLLGWAYDQRTTDDEANDIRDKWEKEGRPSSLTDARFPRTAARLCLMWDRLVSEGFTSFWL